MSVMSMRTPASMVRWRVCSPDLMLGPPAAAPVRGAPLVSARLILVMPWIFWRTLAASAARSGDADVDGVADAGLLDDLLDGAVEEELASFDDADGGAELAELGEDVGGDDDGLAHALELLEELADLDAGAGVESGGGLVHEEDLGVVEEDAGDGEALLHAAAEGVDLGGGFVVEIGEVEDVGDDFAALHAVDVVAGGEELEVLGDDHVFVGAHEVGDVTDEGADHAVLVADGEAVDHGLSEVGLRRVARILMVVVFPAPLGPMKPKHSPCSMVRLRESSATSSP